VIGEGGVSASPPAGSPTRSPATRPTSTRSTDAERQSAHGSWLVSAFTRYAALAMKSRQQYEEARVARRPALSRAGDSSGRRLRGVRQELLRSRGSQEGHRIADCDPCRSPTRSATKPQRVSRSPASHWVAQQWIHTADKVWTKEHVRTLNSRLSCRLVRSASPFAWFARRAFAEDGVLPTRLIS